MSICSCCYNQFTNEGFNVGHWWNNDPDISKVCSVVCKDKLWQMVQDGTWMDHKPVAMFPSAGRKVEPGFETNEVEIRQFGIRGEVVPKVSGDEEVKQVTQNWANSETELRKNGPVALTDKQFGNEEST